MRYSKDMADFSEDDLAAVNTLRAAVLRLSRRLRHGSLVPDAGAAATDRPEGQLSPAEMSVLGVLFRGGPATPGELARKEHVQPPSMTRIVAMLEAKGLVRREPHPQDRRQVVVTQTEQALEILQESRRRKNAWLADLAGGLTEQEWHTLREAAPVLEKLAEL
jgi:DNA-binding MarR family transcriptional regulator